MKLIEVNRSKTDLKRQLNFLIKREFIGIYRKYRRLFYSLVGLTIIILVVSLFVYTDSLIIIKGVFIMMTAIAWAIGLIFLMIILIRWLKRKKWRDTSINIFFKTDRKLFITFDNEKLTFIADTFKSDIKWEFYKYYAEDSMSIYIIPESNIYEAMYFSPKDIGKENFEQLKIIAKSRLTSLN